MRKLIATVFNYSLDGLLADEGTEFWKFCFDLPENREPDDPAQLDFLQSAYAHIMGRTAYESIFVPLPLLRRQMLVAPRERRAGCCESWRSSPMPATKSPRKLLLSATSF